MPTMQQTEAPYRALVVPEPALDAPPAHGRCPWCRAAVAFRIVDTTAVCDSCGCGYAVAAARAALPAPDEPWPRIHRLRNRLAVLLASLAITVIAGMVIVTYLAGLLGFLFALAQCNG